MTTSEEGDLRFGPFELRAAQRRLLYEGRPASLGARAFDVLLVLVAHRGRAVTKDELLAAVWPSQVVEENNLTVQVSALRKLLGPDAIATIPGRGYQFTAAVSPGAPAARPVIDRPLLFGRDDALRALDAALDRHRLVTLTGAAGIGKTAVARAWSAASAAEGREAPIVELAPLSRQTDRSDAGPIATAIGTALGLAPAAGPPVDRLLAHLRGLGDDGRRCVVVLDNCEHVSTAVADLVAMMAAAAPELRVLATSQAPLSASGEQVLRLEPLTVPPGNDLDDANASAAIALFVARVATVVPGFVLTRESAGDALDICRRLDGIPLALELAAARVPLLGLEGVRDRLDERMRLLARSTTPHLARHQTLRAALDWSYSLLSPREQLLLRRLALFVGGFTASTTQQLAGDAGLDDWAVLDALSALVEKSLVVARGIGASAAEPRFTLLETVRDYARAQLEANDEAGALARRHAELFAALARAHAGALGGDLAGARRMRLGSEHDNLRAALAWATSNDVALAARMTAALRTYWRERGHHVEGLASCLALLARCDESTDRALLLPVQLAVAVLANELGDAAHVEIGAQAALETARTLGERVSESNAQAMLAHAAGLRGDVVLRRERFDACLAIHRELGDPKLVAESLNNVASCWCDEGRPALAQPLLEEALGLARAADYRWLEAAILHTLSEVDCARGDFVEARRRLEESLVLRRGFQHQYHLVLALQALAMVALRLERLDAAAVEAREALTLCATHDFATRAIPCVATVAAWAALTGRGVDAAALIGAVDAALRDDAKALQPADLALHADATIRTRASLDEATWTRHWAEGAGLTRIAAVHAALATIDRAGIVPTTASR